MTINNINLIGIEADSYYFLNPIFIRIESQTKFITKATFRFTNKSAIGSDGNDLKTAELKLQSNPEGIIYVDISKYIDSIAIYANGYKSKVSSSDIPNSLNDIDIEVKVSTKTDTTETIFNLSKLFILGYEFTQSTNNFVNSLNLDVDYSMHDHINVPYYFNSNDIYKEYSKKRFDLNKNTRKIEVYNESNFNILNHVQLVGCNYILFRFLNSSGGYNYIAFNRYTNSTNSNVEDENIKVNRFRNNYVSFIGKKVDHEREYTAIQEFDERFKLFADELIRSQYVSVMFGQSDEWQEVDIQQNTMPALNKNSFELSYKFKLLTSINI